MEGEDKKKSKGARKERKSNIIRKDTDVTKVNSPIPEHSHPESSVEKFFSKFGGDKKITEDPSYIGEKLEKINNTLILSTDFIADNIIESVNEISKQYRESINLLRRDVLDRLTPYTETVVENTTVYDPNSVGGSGFSYNDRLHIKETLNGIGISISDLVDTSKFIANHLHGFTSDNRDLDSGNTNRVGTISGGSSRAAGDRTVDKGYNNVKIIGASADFIETLSDSVARKGKPIESKPSYRSRESLSDTITRMGLLGMLSLSTLGVMTTDNPLRGVGTLASKVIGNMIEGLLKNVKGILTGGEITKAIKGVFNADRISKMIKGIFGVGADSAKVAPAVKVASGGAIKGILSKVFTKGFLRRLPIIGTIIGVGSAVARIRDGDYVGGMIDLASAIAVSAGPLGWVLSLGLDILNIHQDIAGTRIHPTGTNWKDKINDLIIRKGRNMPVIGTIIRMGESLHHLFNGRYEQFFMGLGGSFASILPGFGFLYDIIFSRDEETGFYTRDGSLGRVSDLIKNIRNSVADTLVGIFKSIGEYIVEFISESKLIPDFAKDALFATLGFSGNIVKLGSHAVDGVAAVGRGVKYVGSAIYDGIDYLSDGLANYILPEERLISDILPDGTINDKLDSRPIAVAPSSSTSEYKHRDDSLLDEETFNLMKKQNSILEMILEKQEASNAVIMQSNSSSSSVSNNFTHSRDNTTRRRAALAY